MSSLAPGSLEDEGGNDGFALILILGSALNMERGVGSELGPSEAALTFCNCNDGFILILGLLEGDTVGEREGELVGESST